MLLLIFTLIIIDSTSAKSVISQRMWANRCVELWTVQSITESGTQWAVVAGNRCDDIVSIGKRLHVTRAVNVTVTQGRILDIKDFIVSSKGKKVIFYAKKVNPDKVGYLYWQLIR